MAGRYAFSMPERRQRDGWFQIGSIDITSTGFIVLAGLVSMVLYAIDPATVFKGAFATELVRDGEVWRMATWPLTNPPLSVWDLLSLAIFWFLGHMIEDDIGKRPMAVIYACMAIIPTALVTLLNVVNDDDITGRWSAYSFSVSFFSLAAIVVFGLQHPSAKFFFGIPAWAIGAAYVFIEVLRDVGNRAWATLILVLLVIAVGCIGARQRGMLEQLTFIPRIKRFAGPTRSPYGELGSARPRQGSRFGKGKGKGGGRGKGRGRPGPGTGSVVTGPWEQPSGPTPLEQAELDVLLDRISATGIDSLTKEEKARLTALSKRMRGGS